MKCISIIFGIFLIWFCSALSEDEYLTIRSIIFDYLQNHEVSPSLVRLSMKFITETRNFWQPTVHEQQNIFEKILIKVGSSHIYTSFGTFCVQIGQLFEAQWVFEKCLKAVKSLFSKENAADFEFFRKIKIILCLE